MNDANKPAANAATPKVPSDLEHISPARVRGLTIREIRYQRALVALQKEFCKENISMGFAKLRGASPFSSQYDSKGKPMGRAMGIAGKVLGNGMNYVDYAMLGYTVFSNIKKIFGFFKKKKK